MSTGRDTPENLKEQTQSSSDEKAADYIPHTVIFTAESDFSKAQYDGWTLSVKISLSQDDKLNKVLMKRDLELEKPFHWSHVSL